MAFTDLMRSAGLDSPFEMGSIRKTIPALEAILNSIDDKNL